MSVQFVYSLHTRKQFGLNVGMYTANNALKNGWYINHFAQFVENKSGILNTLDEKTFLTSKSKRNIQI